MTEAACIHELFEARAARTPDHPAVVFEDQVLSYGQLNRRADEIAQELRCLKVGPEVLAGIFVERSPEMLAGMLGILKAGGAYLPLDPSYPTERLRVLLEDSQAPVLVTETSLADRLPPHEARALYLDKLSRGASHSASPKSGVRPNNLAYVIYTSGSTGKPKGVQIEHHSVVNLLRSAQGWLGLTDRDSCLMVSTISFDMSVMEIFLPLSIGAAVVIVSRQVAADGMQLRKALADSGATYLQATPATWRLLLEAGWEGGVPLKTACTGEALSRDLANRLLERSDCLWNLYGPTETTVWSMAYHVEPGDGPVPIGRPIAGQTIHLLDSRLRPVPPGQPGELCIGGQGVGRGYLRRPELTSEKFITNPFGESPSDRLYRTGDLARCRPDGNIEFLGRIDRQVKIRGFRIEPGEIERALEEHPTVEVAAVEAREDHAGHKELVAYIEPARGQSPQTGELRGFLAEMLPSYMLPSRFVFLKEMPLTVNRKIDRSALPSPGREQYGIKEAYVAPRGPLEEEVAQIWAEALGLERVGAKDNFLELGGHSLRAAQILGRLRRTFGIQLPLRKIFDCPTVAGLAKVIEEHRGKAEPTSGAGIPKVSRTGDLPLSFSQERVWFIQELDPANRAYTFHVAITFTGPLDVAALERSLNEIVRRHEIYRTTFLAVHGRPVQRIHPAWPVKLPVTDLESIPKSERDAEAERLMSEEFLKPFDLSRLPLIRWRLLRLDSRKHVLTHSEHHMVHDGWSFIVFVGELLKLYKAFTSGEPSALPALPVQFADFAHWERQWIASEAAERQVAYWKRILENSPPPLELPADRPRPPVQSFRGSSLRVQVPLNLCRQVRELCRQEGVTLFMFLLAAFQTLVCRYTGQEDVIVGAGIANRRTPGTEGLIGMLVNNVVLRSDLSGNPTFRELLGRVRELTVEANENQEAPFDRVVAALQPERDLSRNPLFQVMFNFHDTPLPPVELPGLKVDLLETVSNGTAKFDLNVIVIPQTEERARLGSGASSEGITVIWEYCTDLFDEATISRMAGHYEEMLRAIVAVPEQPVSQLPLLTEAERRQLLVEWNETRTGYPPECIHKLFEAQVSRAPDRVAIVCEDTAVSYGELNRRANRVAHELRRQGVGPEALVGICAERSVELVAGMLGILKAGGAYLPLDPEYPVERLKFMLEDSGTRVLLAETRLATRLPKDDVRLLCLDALPETSTEEAENPACGVHAENLAYAMYTSGSTGKPKAALVPHRSVVRLLCNTNYVHLRPNDRIAFASSPSFDATTFEVWGALLHGGQLVVMPKDTVLSPPALARQIREKQITTLFLTPALFHQVARVAPEAFREVENLLVGGEAADPRWVREVLEKGPPWRFLNAYGPTEATTFSTWYLAKDLPEAARALPIGRPISNTRVYILDRHLQPVPLGVPGELCIGGDGVARGYLNRPELTREKFIADPFGNDARSRLYRTGDLARYRPGGDIELLGRLDDQVKIRGFRIEPGEVEYALAQHPAIRQAVVAAKQDSSGDKCLVAYFVARAGQTPQPDELRSFLRQTLPYYMVPSFFAPLDIIPLTPSGKIDRLALPPPVREVGDSRRAGLVAPRTPEEETLAAIWAEVLGRAGFGVFDNFFDLGGDSIHVMKAAFRCNKAGLPLKPRDMFEHQTIAELAAVATKRAGSSQAGVRARPTQDSK